MLTDLFGNDDAYTDQEILDVLAASVDGGDDEADGLNDLMRYVQEIGDAVEAMKDGSETQTRGLSGEVECAQQCGGGGDNTEDDDLFA